MFLNAKKKVRKMKKIPSGKWLPGDIPRDLYIYISAYNNNWKEQKEASGLFECRDEGGMIEIQEALRLEVPPKKGDLPPSALFCPGTRMFVRMNYSSIEIGQLLAVVEIFPDGKKQKRVVKSPSVTMYRWYAVMVSKAGVYIVNGDPDGQLGDRGRPPDLFPMTELRMDYPLWIYPEKVQEGLRLL